MNRARWGKLCGSIAITLLAGGIGSLATILNIPHWYASLLKPVFNPPNWLFGPVWSALYLLMGISLYLIWATRGKRSKARAFIAFGTQLLLNVLWSVVFFGLHQLWLSTIVIILLLGGIIWTMVEFKRIRKVAIYLLVPYLLWVMFATCLNIAVALLN